MLGQAPPDLHDARLTSARVLGTPRAGRGAVNHGGGGADWLRRRRGVGQGAGIPDGDLEDLISRLSGSPRGSVAARGSPEPAEPRSLRKETLRDSVENVGAVSKTLFLFIVLVPSSFWPVRGLFSW